jgi:hypothetical protein
MTVPLRIVTDDGVPHELERLRRDLAGAKRMLQMAHEELEAERAARLAEFRRANRLQGLLTKQEDDRAASELEVAVHAFWVALRGRKLKLGPAIRKKVQERRKDIPPTEPKEFIWPIIGLVLDPQPKRNGKGYHTELELAIRDEAYLRKYAEKGREAVDGQPPRKVIEDLGGRAALDALDRLLELQEQMYPQVSKEGEAQ